MADLTTVAAAILGVGLGALMLAAPDVVIRVQTAGRMPSGRHGEYGTDGSSPNRWRRLVQGLGVLVLLAGLYFGYTAFVA